jgi:hypothetical protein
VNVRRLTGRLDPGGILNELTACCLFKGDIFRLGCTAGNTGLRRARIACIAVGAAPVEFLVSKRFLCHQFTFRTLHTVSPFIIALIAEKSGN